MSQLFWEARSKVERAEEHINDLNRTISEFIDTPNYVAFLERDVASSHNLLKVRATKVLPARFNFVLGDAIHNLRTSLDYAMNEIELLTVGERTTYTKFPIFETAHAFKAAVNGGLKEKAPKQVIECIEDFVQPYRRGNGEPLWCLHLLDIRDKHQLLIANTELTDVTGIRIKDDRGTEHILDTWRVIDHRVAGLPVTGTKNVEITNQGHGTYRVTFNQWLPFGGDEIIPTLHRLAAFIRWTLDEVERAFRLSQITLHPWNWR